MFQTLASLRARRDDGERGFTLIELMVVVLIIAILIAIAIPTFLGARQRAQNRAAQSSLRNGLTAAKTIYTDGEDYRAATTTALAGVEPSLQFVAGDADSTGPNMVSVATPSANEIVMAAKSRSGTCYAIRDNTQGPGTQFATVSGDCNANAANGGGVTWGNQW